MYVVVLIACGGSDTLPVASDASTTVPTTTEASPVPETTVAVAVPATTVEDCAPTTGNGRALTVGEWALLSVLMSAERDSPIELAAEGSWGPEDGFFSWCEVRDHPRYSVGYGMLQDRMDEMLALGLLICELDESDIWVCNLPADEEPTADTSAPTVTVATPVDYPTTSVTGSGSRVVDLEIAGAGLCTITATVTNNVDESFSVAVESNFFVEQVDPPSFDPLWVFGMLVEEGTWEKAVRFDPVESGAVTLQVEAEGDWTIESDCRG